MTTIGIILASLILLGVLVLVYRDAHRTVRYYHRRMASLQVRLARVPEDYYWLLRADEYETACGLYLDARTCDRQHLEAVR